MSDSENSKPKKDSKLSDTPSESLAYTFFDPTVHYSFSSQPISAEPAPAATPDATSTPAVGAASSVDTVAITTPPAPIAPSVAPVPVVPSVPSVVLAPVAPSAAPMPPPPVLPATPAPAAAEPAKQGFLSFSPNFNFSKSIKRVFTALDIDFSNRLSRKELADGLDNNKLHGDEYLLALTLLDYYDEIHNNLFGPRGPDMGASIEEILAYIGVKTENRSSANPPEKDFRGVRQSIPRPRRNTWSRD